MAPKTQGTAMIFVHCPFPYSQSQCHLERTKVMSLALQPPDWVRCIPPALLVQQGDVNIGLELPREIQGKYRDEGVIPANGHVCIPSGESPTLANIIMEAMDGRGGALEAGGGRVQRKETQDSAGSCEVRDGCTDIHRICREESMAASIPQGGLRWCYLQVFTSCVVSPTPLGMTYVTSRILLK